MDDISPNFHETLLDNLYDGVYFVDRERQITFWNKAAERITGFTKAEVLGKRCADNLLRHVDDRGNPLCEGACPLSHTLRDGVLRSASVFLHHKQGHRLPVAIGVSPITDSGQNIIGAVEIFRDDSATIAALEHLKELEDLAYLDGLTRIANRAYLETFVVGKFNELQRLGWSFGVIFLDVDRFKLVNDTFGHQAGDVVLKMVAKTLLKNCRSFDLVGRWGGEEFVCVVSKLKDADQIIDIADRLRVLVESAWVSLADSSLHVTISLGATLARIQDTPETLIHRADELMYQSKAAGRNRLTYK
ncbi:MAG: diguanylate cyclase [Deltaproteobacteria bacterium]|nr:diguanylate cyclase [Deltaproteobacteria bacterium]